MFDELRQLLTTQPFVPFRVHTADGKSYDVRHPEFVSISRSTITIAVPDHDVEADHHVICQVRNIASIETLNSNAA